MRARKAKRLSHHRPARPNGQALVLKDSHMPEHLAVESSTASVDLPSALIVETAPKTEANDPQDVVPAQETALQEEPAPAVPAPETVPVPEAAPAMAPSVPPPVAPQIDPVPLAPPPATGPTSTSKVRMKVWTDPSTRQRYLMPTGFMRDVVNGQPVTDIMYAYAYALDGGTPMRVELSALEWNTLPFFYFTEVGPA